MHDRAVRRRRAVLVALVAASLILLTAYFGESSDGRLHSFQRGALGALSPIQEGASRVLKPFRDLFGWFGDTLDAKAERDRAIKERDDAIARLSRTQAALRIAEQRAGLKDLAAAFEIDQYAPVEARVFIRSPSTWNQRFTIDKGTKDGVRRGDPVVAAGGLIGKVEAVSGGTAVVALITDQSFATGAVTGESRAQGSITSAVGVTGDLLFDPVDSGARISEGELVSTQGTIESRLRSRYPPGIPIGLVSRIDLGDGELDRRIHVKPTADPLTVEVVQVLTEPHADQGQ
jgi:rod shape-determining protein MreC